MVGTPERRALLRALLRAVVVVGVAPLLITACGRRPGATYQPRQRVPITPIGRADRERPNRVTYYLASVTQKNETVTVDMDILNGMGRGFQFVTVWVTFLGTKGEKQQVSQALGPVGPHAQDHVVVQSKGITFQVEDVEVGVQLR